MPRLQEILCPRLRARGMTMFKNITRQLQAMLSRHLPHRLVQRDPLPNAKNMASAAIPASLSQRCLNVAAMDENEVWRAFGGHRRG